MAQVLLISRLMAISLANNLFLNTAVLAACNTDKQPAVELLAELQDGSIIIPENILSADNGAQNAQNNPSDLFAELFADITAEKSEISDLLPETQICDKQQNNHKNEESSDLQQILTIYAMPTIQIQDMQVHADTAETAENKTEAVRTISNAINDKNPVIAGVAEDAKIQQVILNQSLENGETAAKIENSLPPTPVDSSINKTVNELRKNEYNAELAIEQTEQAEIDIPSAAQADSSKAQKSIQDKDDAAPINPSTRQDIRQDNKNIDVETNNSKQRNTEIKSESNNANEPEFRNIKNLEIEQADQQTHWQFENIFNPKSEISSSDSSGDTHLDYASAQNQLPQVNASTSVSVITEQPTAANAPAHHNANSDTAFGIPNRIYESIQTALDAGSKKIVIQLNPPELGKVAIKFTEDANGLTGLLQVDRLHVKHEIQQTLPDIIQNLHDKGIVINKIEVLLTNNHQEQTMKDQSSMAGQYNWSGHENPSNAETYRHNNTYRVWTADSSESFDPFQESDTQFSGTSINMLA